VQGHVWSSDVALIVPIAFLLFGGAGMRHVCKKREKTAHYPGAAQALQAIEDSGERCEAEIKPSSTREMEGGKGAAI
jgi:hypothetical protein